MNEAAGARTARLAAGLLLVATAVVFLPSLASEFLWDDFTLIVHNEYAHDLAHLGRAITTGFWDISSSGLPPSPTYASIYRPVVKVAQLLEWLAFGDAPFGFHLVNVLLHLACVGLAFVWVRRRLSDGTDTEEPSAGAARAAAAAIGVGVFALHPTRPESVTWISGSTDLFMTAFALGAAVLFDRGQSPRRVALACVLAALAVLSKEPAVVLPVLVALDIALVSRPASTSARDALRRARGPLVALFVSVAAAFALRFAFIAIPPPNEIGPVSALALRFAASMGHYVTSTVDPFSPSTHPAIRRHDASLTPIYETSALVAFALLAILSAALVVLARRSRTARAGLADVSWFVLPLLSAANIVPIGHYSLVSERFLYLSHLGLAAIVARVLQPALSKPPPVRTVAFALGTLVVLALGATTVEREAHFLTERDLWTYEIGRDPKNLTAALQLAELDRKEHRYEEALVRLAHTHDVAVAEHDRVREVDAMLLAADTALLVLSDADQDALVAIRAFYQGIVAGREVTLSAPPLEARLELAPSERRAVLANVEDFRVPLALSLVRTLELARATEVLEAILADDETAASAWNLLAITRARSLDFGGARQALAEAERRLPGHPTFARTGRAIDAAERAIGAPASDEVERALAIAAAQVALGAPEAARRALAPLLSRSPTHPALVMARARVDLADRRFDLARETILAARALDPAHAAEWDRALASLADAEREGPRPSRGPSPTTDR